MTNLEIRDRAKSILGSGENSQIQAFKSGIQGDPKFYPQNNTGDSYKLGLNLFFNRLGLGDAIRAEQIIKDDPLLQQGFFDRFYAVPCLLQQNETAKLNSERNIHRHRKRLDELKNSPMSGLIQKDYQSYLKGSFLAVEVWETALSTHLQNSCQVPEDATGYQEDKSNPLEKELLGLTLEKEFLERRLKESNPEFTIKQIKEIEFYKYLRQKGKI